MKEDKPKYDLEDRLLEYATRIIRFVESLPSTLAGRHVAGQLLRSGTNPLSQHGEAQAAESPEDFRHKMKVGLKELKETWRWLRLSKNVPLIKSPANLDSLLQETDELIRIFVTSIRTSATNSAKISKKQAS
jgi:four helix bundle protein